MSVLFQMEIASNNASILLEAPNAHVTWVSILTAIKEIALVGMHGKTTFINYVLEWDIVKL